MCFHNSMTLKAVNLAARYNKKMHIDAITQQSIESQYHINGFAYPKCAIITNSDEVQVYQWGLIPFWVKNEEEANELRKLTLNARADTIFKKPSFRESIIRKRCIIPSTGYFEWRHEGDKKIPYYIYVKETPVFSIAGVHDSWVDKETGEIINTFSMITTDANSLTSYIHNTLHRMPVILSKPNEAIWLSDVKDHQAISDMLTPYPANEMDAYIIQNDFLRKADNDPTILDRAV